MPAAVRRGMEEIAGNGACPGGGGEGVASMSLISDCRRSTPGWCEGHGSSAEPFSVPLRSPLGERPTVAALRRSAVHTVLVTPPHILGMNSLAQNVLPSNTDDVITTFNNITKQYDDAMYTDLPQ